MRKVIVALAGCLLAGCVTTQETPLSANTMRIDTEAGGWLFAGQAAPATLKAAARATIAAGYTHFRLSNVTDNEQGGIVCGVGGGVVCLPLHGETRGVTVTMLRRGGGPGVYDAAKVLKD